MGCVLWVCLVGSTFLGSRSGNGWREARTGESQRQPRQTPPRAFLPFLPSCGALSFFLPLSSFFLVLFCLEAKPENSRPDPKLVERLCLVFCSGNTVFCSFAPSIAAVAVSLLEPPTSPCIAHAHAQLGQLRYSLSLPLSSTAQDSHHHQIIITQMIFREL